MRFFLHQLEHIPVADRSAQKLQVIFLAEFMKAEVRHHRRHKALGPELSLCGQILCADGHDLVAVNLLALLVNGQTPVGVAVKRKAKIVSAVHNGFRELSKMR